MNYFACNQCMNKGGGDEVSEVIDCLFFRVPWNFPNLLHNLLGHSGKNDMTHYQPLEQFWKSAIKILLNSLVTNWHYVSNDFKWSWRYWPIALFQSFQQTTAVLDNHGSFGTLGSYQMVNLERLINLEKLSAHRSA